MNKTTLIILILIAILYTIVIIPTWKENYIDFGDGNYIYISKRMADGLMLYKDILAPQPPIHLYTGKLIAILGNLLGINSPLIPFRFFSLIIHIATFFLVFKTTKKIVKHDYPAIIAGIAYMIIPIGFWWTRGYQSEPLEVLFLLLSFYYFIDFTKKGMVISAIFSALAALTNMTAVPYIFFNLLYIIIRKRKLFVSYFIPFFLVMMIVMIFFELRTGRYFENVFFNQVGSYPKKELYPQGVIHYAIKKITGEGKDIIFWEGAYIILSLLGLISYLKQFKDKYEKEYVALFTICALGSFIYVTKGATMEYIFTIGEPFAVIFIGFFLWSFIKDNLSFSNKDILSISDLSPIFSYILFFTAILIVCIIGIVNSIGTIMQKNDELDENGVHQIKYFIETYSKPTDKIFAPPFYAVVSKRIIFEEYSELFLWTIKYWNEMIVEKKPALGVQKIQSLANALNKRQIPIVVVENAQTGRIPEIAEALKNNYIFAPPLKEPYKTFNTQLLIMIPKDTEIEPSISIQ